MAHAGFPNGIGKTVEYIADNIKNDTDHTYRHLIIKVDQHSIEEMHYCNKGQYTSQTGAVPSDDPRVGRKAETCKACGTDRRCVPVRDCGYDLCPCKDL